MGASAHLSADNGIGVVHPSWWQDTARRRTGRRTLTAFTNVLIDKWLMKGPGIAVRRSEADPPPTARPHPCMAWFEFTGLRDARAHTCTQPSWTTRWRTVMAKGIP